MTTAAPWAPAKLYPTGSICVPRTNAAGSPLPAFTNPGFETGDDTGWEFDPGVSVSNDTHYSGSYCVKFTGSSGQKRCFSTLAAAAPGMKITATCQYKQGAASSGHNTGAVTICWLDSSFALLREDVGNLITSGKNGAWHLSSITGIAPANTAWFRVCGLSNRSDSDSSYCDDFTWANVGTITQGLVFRAVQPTTGLSGSTEPAWPTANGVQVTDNEVIWEAFVGSRITWQARSILKSGPTEPDWNTEINSATPDNTISWLAVNRSIGDPKCPQSAIVVIGASKVFAGDDDIVPYSATVNPLDWSTAEDAGFIPYGLQLFGANPVAAMGLYRSNLMVWNSEAFQMWQIDEDPENMALLDALPIGCTRHFSVTPVSNDLFFLSSQGVRTVGIAGASTNLQAGDVGMPIDPLVQVAVAAADDAEVEPIGLYYPAAGQYWLIFADRGNDTSEAFVYSMTKLGGVGAWSRYTFPYAIDDWAVKGDDLYLRSADKVFRVGDDLLGDKLDPAEDPVPFEGMIQWPWLDFGAPGQTKMMVGFDCVCDGAPMVSIGYDQTNQGTFTSPYEVPADTVPGMIIPMPLAAPSFSVRLTFDGTESWHFRALNLYLNDNRITS